MSEADPQVPPFRLLDAPLPSSLLGAWEAVVGPFTQVVGWTALGDAFLRDPTDGHYALLLFAEPRVVALRHDDPAALVGMLARTGGFAERLLRPGEIADLAGRLGPLGPDEVFVPHAFPPPIGPAPYYYRKGTLAGLAATAAEYHGVGHEAAIDPLLRHLRLHDDPALWRAVLGHVLAEFAPRVGATVQVGRCSHWLRPHQSRWTADGGFAAPVGYGSGTGGYCFDALPQFDWSVVLAWTGRGWATARPCEKTTQPALRLTVPSRTMWHPQAAVHAVWTTGREKERRRYGFRKAGGAWRCTAETDWAEDRPATARRCR